MRGLKVHSLPSRTYSSYVRFSHAHRRICRRGAPFAAYLAERAGTVRWTNNEKVDLSLKPCAQVEVAESLVLHPSTPVESSKNGQRMSLGSLPI